MPAPRAQVAVLLLALSSAPLCAGAQASADSLPSGVLLRELADSTLWPEGVDRDPRTGDFYLASVRHRTIVRLSANGSEHELWPRAIHASPRGHVLGDLALGPRGAP